MIHHPPAPMRPTQIAPQQKGHAVRVAASMPVGQIASTSTPKSLEGFTAPAHRGEENTMVAAAAWAGNSILDIIDINKERLN